MMAETILMDDTDKISFIIGFIKNKKIMKSQLTQKSNLKTRKNVGK